MCPMAAGSMRELASQAGPKGGLKSFVSEWCSALSLSRQTPVWPTWRTAVVTPMGKLDRCWRLLCPRDVPQADTLPAMERV